MGFAGSMVVLNNGQGLWGLGSGIPFSYDRLAEDGSNRSLLNEGTYPNPSVQLANALQSNNVNFVGSEAMTANGSADVPLYAPATWVQGTSYSHLDSSYGATSDALMIGFLSRGVAIQSLGPVTQGLMQDIGWNQAEDGVPWSALVNDIYMPSIQN